jgi:hypothetical protein
MIDNSLPVDTAGTNATALRVKSGGIVFDLATVATPTAPGLILSNVRAVDPNMPQDWTPPGIDALEVGAVETTAVLSRLSEVYLMVEFILRNSGMLMLGAE